VFLFSSLPTLIFSSKSQNYLSQLISTYQIIANKIKLIKTFLLFLSGGGAVGSGIKLATIAKNMTPEKN